MDSPDPVVAGETLDIDNLLWPSEDGGSLSCFPTPPYENPDDSDWYPMDIDSSCSPCSVREDSLGGRFSPHDNLSELESVNFSDIFSLDAVPVRDDDENSVLDQLVNELDKADIPIVQGSSKTDDLSKCNSGLNIDKNDNKVSKNVNSVDPVENWPLSDSSSENDSNGDSEKEPDIQMIDNKSVHTNPSPPQSNYLGSASQYSLRSHPLVENSPQGDSSSENDGNGDSEEESEVQVIDNEIPVNTTPAPPQSYSLSSAQQNSLSSHPPRFVLKPIEYLGSQPAIKMMKVSAVDQYRCSPDERPRRTCTRSKLSTGKSAGKKINNVLAEVEPSRRAALQAKLNREKKKVYVTSLETERDSLKRENSKLKESSERFENQCKALTDEVEYLKNVLANQSVLAGLLKNIDKMGGVSLSSSLSSNKRKHKTDHDYDGKAATMSSGICLHVDKDNVSLEFCSECAKKSKFSAD